MNPFIQLKTIRAILIPFVLACFALSPAAKAVTPAPDGGYPGNNTAEGELALLHLDVNTSMDNTAVGFDALSTAIVSFGNTAVGSSAMDSAGGNYNVAIGFAALFQNATGADENTA